MVAAIGKKVEIQTERMRKLGIGSEKPVAIEFEPKGVPPAIPPAIIK